MFILIEDAEPLRIRIKAQGGLKNDSDLLIDQIRVIDNKRIIDGPLLRCKEKFLDSVYEAIQEVMGIADLYVDP